MMRERYRNNAPFDQRYSVQHLGVFRFIGVIGRKNGLSASMWRYQGGVHFSGRDMHVRERAFGRISL